jgi:hypothetical protein
VRSAQRTWTRRTVEHVVDFEDVPTHVAKDEDEVGLLVEQRGGDVIFARHAVDSTEAVRRVSAGVWPNADRSTYSVVCVKSGLPEVSVSASMGASGVLSASAAPPTQRLQEADRRRAYLEHDLVSFRAVEISRRAGDEAKVLDAEDFERDGAELRGIAGVPVSARHLS